MESSCLWCKKCTVGGVSCFSLLKSSNKTLINKLQEVVYPYVLCITTDTLCPSCASLLHALDEDEARCVKSKEKIALVGVEILPQLIATNYSHANLYVCTQCQLHFTVEDCYRRHKLHAHKGKLYKCTQCTCAYYYAVNLNEHLNKAHGIVSIPCFLYPVAAPAPTRPFKDKQARYA